MDVLALTDGRTRAAIVPALGGGIAAMEALPGDGASVPVLRPWSGKAGDGPFALASNVLVPFSNRISGGGFPFDGAFHAVPANLEGEDLPIHGDGFQRAWHIDEAADTRVRLSLAEGAIGPFRYAARLDYALSEGALASTLSLRNTGAAALPFGAGFHPWFPRGPGTRLFFAASHVWLEDSRHLPTELVALADLPEWDFHAGRPLPAGWINNAFVGWSRTARIEQPDDGIVVELQASPGLETAIVYSPDNEASFFCFEPVTHSVDAHNHPHRPGLKVLGPGEELEVQMALGWRPLG